MWQTHSREVKGALLTFLTVKVSLTFSDCTNCPPAALSVLYTYHAIITTDLSLRTTASQHIPFIFPLWSGPLLKRGVENDMQSQSNTETVNCDCYISQARLFHDGTISAVGAFRNRVRSKRTSNICSRPQFSHRVPALGWQWPDTKAVNMSIICFDCDEWDVGREPEPCRNMAGLAAEVHYATDGDILQNLDGERGIVKCLHPACVCFLCPL